MTALNTTPAPAKVDQPMTDITETARELRGLLAKATKRPWRVFSSKYGDGVTAIMKGNAPGYDTKGNRASRWKEIVAWPGFDGSDVGKRYNRPNAELIVAAVNALPHLLDHLTAYERQVEQMRAERDALVAELSALSAATDRLTISAQKYIKHYLSDERDTPEFVGIDAEQHGMIVEMDDAITGARTALATLDAAVPAPMNPQGGV